SSRNRDDEISKNFALPRLERVGLGALEHHVRLSQLPSLGKNRGLGLLRGIAFTGTLLDPLLDQCNLIVPQTTRIQELAVTSFRQPRRHGPRERRLGDLTG